MRKFLPFLFLITFATSACNGGMVMSDGDAGTSMADGSADRTDGTTPSGIRMGDPCTFEGELGPIDCMAGCGAGNTIFTCHGGMWRCVPIRPGSCSMSDPDAGSDVVDAGSDTRDAGPSDSDAGMVATDAGMTGSDAGTCAEAGRVCEVGRGLCQRFGTFSCGPTGAVCSASPGAPSTEVCGNGVDEDCDGLDATCVSPPPPPPCGTLGATRTCYSGPVGTDGRGACHGGTQTCQATGWSACVGEVTPVTETAALCGNGVDEDCNGSDLACVVPPPPCAPVGSSRACAYTGPALTLGVGACRAGTQTCQATGWSACTGEVVPTSESAALCGNGVDEDCNGSDLACVMPPPSGRVVYEFRVTDAAFWGTVGGTRLANQYWAYQTCLNTGSLSMEARADGWFRCTLAARLDPSFVGVFESSARSWCGDTDRGEGCGTAAMSAAGTCTNASGVEWRVSDEATGANLIGADGLRLVTVAGQCRHGL
jgi:hypothetical protein